MLAPCLVIYTLAPSHLITFKTFWRCTFLSHHLLGPAADFPNQIRNPAFAIVWPIPVLALITHAISIIFALTINRFLKAPSWLVVSLSYNKYAFRPPARDPLR